MKRQVHLKHRGHENRASRKQWKMFWRRETKRLAPRLPLLFSAALKAIYSDDFRTMRRASRRRAVRNKGALLRALHK